jgi:hypothetical protein
VCGEEIRAIEAVDSDRQVVHIRFVPEYSRVVSPVGLSIPSSVPGRTPSRLEYRQWGYVACTRRF